MRRKVVLCCGLASLVLLGALLAGWESVWQLSIHYLPEESPAHWIVYPTVSNPQIYPLGEQRTVFFRSLELPRPPMLASLQVRAFGGFTVQVNGQTLAGSETNLERDWKRKVEVDAASALVAGTNRLTITVSNDEGPPALWLTLTVGDVQIISDGQWECSLLGAVVQPARLADMPPELRPGNSIAEGESVWEALKRDWPTLLVLLLLAIIGVIGLDFGVRRGTFARMQRIPGFAAILTSIAVIWLVLLVNNGKSLRFAIGFDADEHAKYIQYIQQHASLPLASDGFEMHQPPLYYLVSAATLKMLALDAQKASGLLALRGLALLTGLALMFLLIGCLRLLLPQSPLQQSVGLVVAACLPMHLYLMHYLSNDLLAGTLALAAVYVGLTVLRADAPSNGRLAALGFCLGAAVLTKLTTLAMVPVIPAILAGRLAVQRRPARAWLRILGIPLLVCAGSAGWFFLRNVSHFHTPIIGSYDPRSGFRWWQDPGYVTAAQGLRFGRSLHHPFYSVFDGIPDGIYSTVWGDGSWGGAVNRETRPPWNYDRMAAGFVLALIPSSLMLVGAAAALVELVRRPRAEWFLMVGIPASVGLALLYHYIRYPYCCHLKGYYTLPAVLSLCAFAGWGFTTLTIGSRWRQLVLGSAVAAWALVAYTSFWVDNQAVTTQLWVAGRYWTGGKRDQALVSLKRVLDRDPENALALSLLGQTLLARQPNRAAKELQHALEIDPKDADTHVLLGSALLQIGQTSLAGQHLEQAVVLGPDSFAAHLLLAKVRWFTADISGTRSAAENGLRVVPINTELHELLAAALAAEGRIDDAAQHYHIALRWQPNSVFALKGLARLLATCEDERSRDGEQAVRLARNACELTGGRDIEAFEALAAAYAEIGRYGDAERLLHQILATQPPFLKESLQRQLRLYQLDKPLRDKPRFGPLRPASR
jgi:cytochrome c-type biogenesis protein CcmH/NrfG